MIIGIILFWLSIFGYLLFFRKKTNVPFELLLPLIFTLISIVMFIAGILNIMKIMVIIVCLSGILLLIHSVIKNGLNFGKILDANFIIICVICLYLTLVCSEMHLLHYDNFSHWGLIIKNMFLNNRLPNFEDLVITFKGYQPGSACFIYYFGALTGKTEGSMIVAQNYLIVGYFFSLLVFIRTNKRKDAKRKYLLNLLLISVYIFILFGNIVFNDLLVDTLIACMSIYSFVLLYYFKDDLKKAFIYNLPVLVYLFLVKNTGILLVGFTCLGLIYLGFRNKQIKKGFIYAILTGVIVMFFFYIWSKHVSYVYGSGALESKHSFSLNNFSNQLNNKGLDKIIEFSKIYINHFFDICNNIPNKYMIGINIIICLMIFLYKNYRSHFLGCLFVTNGIYLLYYSILGVMYLLSMPWEEAVILASFDRYMMTIIFVVIGLVLIWFINVVMKEKKLSLLSSLMTVSLGVIILGINFKYYVTDYEILVGNLNYKSTTPYMFDSILGTERFSASSSNYYYIYAPIQSNNDFGYVSYLAKYKLNTRNVTVIKNISQFNNDFSGNSNNIIIVLDEDDAIMNYIKENEFVKKDKLYIK